MKEELNRIEEYIESKNSYLFKDNVQLEYRLEQDAIELIKINLNSRTKTPFARFVFQDNLWKLFYYLEREWKTMEEYASLDNLVKVLILIEEDKNRHFW